MRSLRLLPVYPLFFLALSNAQPSPLTDSTSANFSDDVYFRNDVLNATNLYRVQHNASRIEWNETLAEAAQDWADGCVFEHSGGPYGENLGSGYASGGETVKAWGDERDQYDFDDGDFSEDTGHFTQLVWQNTTQVGCARKECNGDTSSGEGDAPGWYVVCEYWPRGNVIGQFLENVQDNVEGEGGQEDAAGSLSYGAATLWAALVISCAGTRLL